MNRRSTTRRCVTAAVAALALAGCSDATAPTAPPAVSPTAPGTVASAPATGPTDAESVGGESPDAPDAGTAAFVAVVQRQLPEIALDRRDEEITAIAEQACVGLAADLSADQIIAETRTLGTEDAEAADAATARELVKLAIDTACRDQASRVDEF